MESISLTSWSRPVKLIFLVNNEEQLVQAISYCSITWGGIYNELFFADDPPDFDKKTYDYIVLFTTIEEDQDEFNSKKIEFKDLFTDDYSSGKEYPAYIDTLPIARDLNQIGTKISIVKSNSLIEYFRFGILPKYSFIDYSDHYKNKIKSEELETTPNPLESYNFKTLVTPLAITNRGLYLKQKLFLKRNAEAVVFIGKYNDAKIVSQLWNARSYGKTVEIVEETDDTNINDFKTYLDSVGERTNIERIALFIPDEEVWKKIDAQDERYKYMRIGDLSALNNFGTIESPYVFETEHENLLAHLDGHRLHFKHIPPIYLSALSGCNKNQRVGICIEMPNIYKNISKDYVHAVPNFENKEFCLLSSSAHRDHVRIHGNTITQFEHSFGFTSSLFLNDFQEFFRRYLYDKNLEYKFSPGGKNLETIIQNYGGIDPGCRIFKLPAVRALLFRLESNRNLSMGEAWQLVNKTWSKAGKEWGLHYITKANIFDQLCKRNILRFGYKKSCEFCHNSDWYSIKDISKVWTCRFCEKDNLTGVLIDRERAFKSNGVFQIKGGGNGALTNLLALWRFNHNTLSDRINYLPSFEILDKDTKAPIVECDTLISLSKSHKSHPSIILIEGKSTNDLEQKDIDSMIKLQTIFDVDTYLCFATLKDKFNPAEVILLKQLTTADKKLILLASDELNPYEIYGRLEVDSGFIGDLDNFAVATQKKYL
jgi:hypothetical protein